MAGPIRIAILANGKQARAEAAATAGSLSIIGKSASKAGKLIGGAFAVGALTAVAVKVGKIGSAYVDSLNQIQALTGSTDAQMARLSSRLESQRGAFAKFGQTTGDAAQGMVELTKSGLTANKALGAIRGTMTLAKAGQLEVADASELVANTLNTFGLKASKAADIANALANAANISSANVTDVAESFKYVAPLAAKAGVSLEETNAVLAELANSGIKASQAGTSLRTFLLNLQTPSAAGAKALKALNVSVYDAQGNMKPLPNLIGQLSRGLGKLDQAGQNAALKDIFGKIGVTGAQIILKNGVDGLAKYTAGVKRAGAATKLAETSSQGLKGTLTSLKANATSFAQEIYRKYSPALDSRLQNLSHWIGDNKDEMSDAARVVGSRLAPALSDLADIAHDAAVALKETAGPVGKVLVPALDKLAGIVTGALDAINSLPGPVKTLAVQAGIAALVFPKLSGGITAAAGAARSGATYVRLLGMEMQTSSGRATILRNDLAKLGGAAKAAAGVAGLVLLTQAAQETNGALSTLEFTAGGAAVGAAFGPIGAAVGGLGGLLIGVSTKFDLTGEAARKNYREIAATDPLKQADSSLKSLKASLDQVTGAYTGATRAAVLNKLQQAGIIATAAKYGISARSVVNAALGQKGALQQTVPIVADYKKRIAELSQAQKDIAANPAFQSDNGLTRAGTEQFAALEKQKKGLQENLAELQKMPGALRQQAHEVQAAAAATRDYSGKLKGLPKSLRTEIRADGVQPNIRAVARLAERYHLMPRQISTLLKAAGVEPTVRNIKRVQGAVKDIEKTRPNLTPALRSVQQFGNDAKRRAVTAGTEVSSALARGTSKAKANMDPYLRSIQSGNSRARAIATSGGISTGSALGQGMYNGVSGWAGPIASRAASIVSAAVAAAKARGKIQSPSKVMRDEVGAMLGEGIAVGLKKSQPKVKTETQRLLATIRAQAVRGTDGVGNALDRVSTFVDKTLDQQLAAREKSIKKRLKGKAETKALNALQAAWKKHSRSVTKSMLDERAALAANGKAQDANARRLDTARQKLSDAIKARADYAKAIKSTVVGFGSVISLGEGVGFGSVDQLIAGMRDRVNKAADFAATIKRLTAAKLNRTTIQQLLDAGPDSLGTAQAILTGGSSAIKQINDLQGKLATTGSSLGTKMASTYYDAGVKAAQGVVKGLESQAKRLDRQAVRLANALVKAVKKALGIHSPSRVFANIGKQTSRGLQYGIKVQDTYVKRSGASMAAAVEKGYASRTPSLDVALSASPAAGGQSLTIHLTADQVDQLQRGRKYSLDIAAYQAVGGRKL